MLYRKSPPTPPRFLLRIAAAAGAGTLFGIAACGGAESGIEGAAPAIPSDASVDAPLACGAVFCGLVSEPVDASDTDSAQTMTSGLVSMPDDAGLACGNGVCGSVGHLPDAGDAGDKDADATGDADSGLLDGPPADAIAVDGGLICHPCGVVVHVDE
jgi:hypothetical protein